MRKIFTAGLVIIASLQSFSDDSKNTYVMCRNGSVVRTIRVELKGQACRAYYTKEGVDKEVGKSGTPQVCLDVTDRIRKNLESSSWKCKDVNQARVSSSLAD